MFREIGFGFEVVVVVREDFFHEELLFVLIELDRVAVEEVAVAPEPMAVEVSEVCKRII